MRNILAVVMNVTEDGLYQLELNWKKIKLGKCESTIHFMPKNLLRIRDIPNHKIPLKFESMEKTKCQNMKCFAQEML